MSMPVGGVEEAGLVPIVFGMMLVAYVQREFNRVIDGASSMRDPRGGSNQ
jgi:hypothetical protein